MHHNFLSSYFHSDSEVLETSLGITSAIIIAFGIAFGVLYARGLSRILRLCKHVSYAFPSVMAPIPASRLQSQPQSSNLSLDAPIPALRLQSQIRGSNPSLKAQIPAMRP